MVTVELADAEAKTRPLPPPSFIAAFTAPHLRWPSTKRLRCSYPASSSPLRFSPSRSPLRKGGATPAPNSRPGSPLPPRSPTPSDRPKFFFRPRKPIRRDEAGEPPPRPSAQRSYPSCPSPPEEAKGAGEGEIAAGRTLRSNSRRTGEEDEENGRKIKRRVELWVPLSRGEIEEDFLRMTGFKPPRRCRLKRRSTAPDALIGVFPGSWLPNKISAERYKVAEPSNPGEAFQDF